MKTVVFAHRGELLPEKTLLPGKMELFDKIQARDINPVLSLNGESAFTDGGVEVAELTSEYSYRKSGSVALDEVGVIVNRLDRSMKQNELPTSWVEADIPVVNNNELRSLVHRKHRFQNEILEPLDMGIPSLLVECLEDAASFVEAHDAAEYILKPTSGTFSKGVMRIKRDNVTSMFTDESLLGKTIIQPAYDFSQPFPETFRPYDEAAKTDFEHWSASTVTKELRMYGFYTSSQTDVFPVARAMRDGEDSWFFIDPESTPEELYTTTRTVLSRVAHLTGSQAIYGALDIGYGSSSRDTESDYHIVEFNGRMPYLVGYDKHADVADTVREMKADQVQRIITDKGVQ